MRLAIVGFDVEGRASFDYFAAAGYDITICDQNPNVVVPRGAAAQLGQDYLRDLDRFDLIVRTPGLHPRKILAANPGVASKITTQTNEFMNVCPTKNIIGVTGTKGKGTTSSLITNMLQSAGLDAHLGGNIGMPPLSFVGDLTPNSWVVLELSSFQLIDAAVSPHIAVCLMVVPEHLDWHSDFSEYTTAKAQLFAHQNTEDIAIYFAENDTSQAIAAASPGAQIPYFAPPGAEIIDGNVSIDGHIICSTAELRLVGTHNWQNVCAGVTAAWQVTQDTAALRDVLTTFSGLPHRLEHVAEIDGVSYYDDSFATTPAATIVAIQAFRRPQVLILGGSDKGADYDELARTVASHEVAQVLLVGSEAPKIQAALEYYGFRDFASGGTSMKEIVHNAQAAAKPGYTVLLSPGCASFDMFRDYKDRGEQFQAAVRQL